MAERADGEPQHQVVQGRLAVAEVQGAEQIVQREARLVNADRLVQPDPPRHRQAQPQSDQDHRGEDEQRGLAAGVRLTPSREAALRAEQVSLMGTAQAPEGRSH